MQRTAASRFAGSERGLWRFSNLGWSVCGGVGGWRGLGGRRPSPTSPPRVGGGRPLVPLPTERADPASLPRLRSRIWRTLRMSCRQEVGSGHSRLMLAWASRRSCGRVDRVSTVNAATAAASPQDGGGRGEIVRRSRPRSERAVDPCVGPVAGRPPRCRRSPGRGIAVADGRSRRSATCSRDTPAGSALLLAGVMTTVHGLGHQSLRRLPVIVVCGLRQDWKSHAQPAARAAWFHLPGRSTRPPPLSGQTGARRSRSRRPDLEDLGRRGQPPNPCSFVMVKVTRAEADVGRGAKARPDHGGPADIAGASARRARRAGPACRRGEPGAFVASMIIRSG